MARALDEQTVTEERLQELVEIAQEDDKRWVMGLFSPRPPPLTRGLVRELLAASGAPPARPLDLAQTGGASASAPKPGPAAKDGSKESKEPVSEPMAALRRREAPSVPVGGAAVTWARQASGASTADAARSAVGAINEAVVRPHAATGGAASPGPAGREAVGADDLPDPGSEPLTEPEAARLMARMWRMLSLPAVQADAGPGWSPRGPAGRADRLASLAAASGAAATPPARPLAGSAVGGVPGFTLGPSASVSRSVSMAAGAGGAAAAAMDAAIDAAAAAGAGAAVPAPGRSSSWSWSASSFGSCPFVDRIVLPGCGEILTSIRKFVQEVVEEAEEAREAREASGGGGDAPELRVMPPGEESGAGGGRRSRPPPLEVEEGGLVKASRVREFLARLRQAMAGHPQFRPLCRAYEAERRRGAAGVDVVPGDVATEAEARVRLAEVAGRPAPAMSAAMQRAVGALEWERALEGAQRLVMAGLRPALYPSGPQAEAVQRHLRARVWALSWVGPHELEVDAPPPEVAPALRLARQVFRGVSRLASPGDMVDAMAAACASVSAAMEASLEMQGKSEVGADDLLPIVIWCVIRAGDASSSTLATDLMYAGRYAPPAVLRDHRGYFFTSVLSAAEFCRAADSRMLRMDRGDMERRMREAHDAAEARVVLEVERGVAEEQGRPAAAGGGGAGRRRGAAEAGGGFSDDDESDGESGEAAGGGAGEEGGPEREEGASPEGREASAGGKPGLAALTATSLGVPSLLLAARAADRCVRAMARAGGQPPAEEAAGDDGEAEEGREEGDVTAGRAEEDALLRALAELRGPGGWPGLRARARRAAARLGSKPAPTGPPTRWDARAIQRAEARSGEALSAIDAAIRGMDATEGTGAAREPEAGEEPGSVGDLWRDYTCARAWLDAVEAHVCTAAGRPEPSFA